ncbi:hypothetical protein CTAYLR_002153 [Chrysophaeum taylorii]|uniref:TLC domain-containing protein n=1 Tax=Chrysophaeum taylorii TaxID=2483200 RepID=A0AAD7UNP2_9STRA|nr:hypothetical protein CTAYLR_002153 [Chrysophaeum taylorii]
MSFLATLKCSVVPSGALAMGGWCGAYAALHQSVYYTSFLAAPGGSTLLDSPHPKYFQSTLRRVTTARIMAFTHAVVSWVWSIRVLSGAWGTLRASRQGVSWASFVAYDFQNTSDGLAFMRHSLGYFVQEFLYVAIHEPDPLYLAHHTLYLAATYPVAASGSGWPIIAISTTFAEFTNPIQLLWEMTRVFGYDEAYARLSLPFTVAFTLCRGVLMPITLVDMANYLLKAPKSHPTLIYAWVLCLLGVTGSFLWLIQLVRGFLRFRRKKLSRKD